MQGILKRLVNKFFRRWNTVVCHTFMLLMIIILLLNWSKLILNSIKANNDEAISAPVSHVRELIRQKTPYDNYMKIANNTIINIDNKNVRDKVDFSNINLKRIVKQLNAKQKIRNLDKYGPLTNDSLIVVIQVHTRINYLNETIKSLSEARGIKDVLLIFSHDYYDVEINNLVMEIDFCKTLQIFFPYSSQIYTNRFPGQSPNDCPQSISLDEAKKTQCINAMFPDRYGNYRNANITQTKHHWWWKVNTVFDKLEAVENYNSLILFIEEDHYMLEDFIHALKAMHWWCPRSKIFSLGTHSNNVLSKNPKVTVSNWISNLGLSFNRSVWHELVQCANEFCYYDDYNWDWSLQRMTKICYKNTFWTSTLLNSRVYHIGKCGMHHNSNTDCTDMSHVIKIKQNLTSLNLKMLPEIVYEQVKNEMLNVGNGGWGDPRDHELCMNMVVNIKP